MRTVMLLIIPPMRASLLRPISLCLALAAMSASVVSAQTVTVDNARQQASSVIESVIAAYEARIRDLESENTRLKSEIAALRGTGSVTTQTVATSTGLSSTGAATATSTGVIGNTVTVSATGSIATLAITGNETLDRKYRAIMQRIQDNKDFVLRTNEMGTGASIGLFEFIEPDAFFISLDDGRNPTGQTAFRRKVLYKYDTSYAMQVTGIFDFDFASAKYVTKFGSNPYAASVRTKVKNPYYVGKLLESVPSVTSGTAVVTPSAGSGTVTAATTAVTVDAIKAAFFADKIDEAVKLSDALLASDPNNIAVRKIRYRGLYRLERYADALAEIERVRAIQGTGFEYTVACEAKTVAKMAGQTAKQTEYGAICDAR